MVKRYWYETINGVDYICDWRTDGTIRRVRLKTKEELLEEVREACEEWNKPGGFKDLMTR